MVEKVFSRFEYDPQVIQSGVRQPLQNKERAAKRTQSDVLLSLEQYCQAQSEI